MKLRALAPIAATLFVASALGACGMITSEADGYTNEIRTNFVESCSGPGNITEAQCGCIYEDVTENMDFDEFIRIDKEMQADPNATPEGAEEAYDHAFEECLS